MIFTPAFVMQRLFIYLFIFIFIDSFQPTSAVAQTPVDSAVLSNDRVSVKDTLAVSMKDTLPVSKPAKPTHLYRMNYWVSIPFCVVASAADVYAIPTIIKSKPDLTPQELQAVNRNAITKFDRWALEQDPSKRQMYLNAADYGLPVAIVIPGLLAFNKNIRKDWVRILTMYYEMQAVTFSIYNFSPFGPAFQDKYRPVVYYTQLSDAERAVGNNRNSMYSGHAATAIASTFFMVKVYCDYHPELNQKKYLLYAAATIPGFIIGYLRVKGMEHFPSDVLVGMTIGAACGILVPEIHRFKNHKVEFNISSSPTGGAGLGMLWNIDQK
jgi:membrane-associated phospholipid phosphatase